MGFSYKDILYRENLDRDRRSPYKGIFIYGRNARFTRVKSRRCILSYREIPYYSLNVLKN